MSHPAGVISAALRAEIEALRYSRECDSAVRVAAAELAEAEAQIGRVTRAPADRTAHVKRERDRLAERLREVNEASEVAGRLVSIATKNRERLANFYDGE